MTFQPPSRPAARFSCVSFRALTLALGLAGAANWSTAQAADDSSGADTPHTSWAASVKTALANKAHRAAEWTQQGVASWYGHHFHGRRTSSGAVFDTNSMTAAHPSLPIGTKLLVTSQDTGRSVVVTINDRGPFNSRIIDLSHAAAARIGMLGRGTAHVTLARLPDANAPDGGAMEVAEADPSDTSDQAVANANSGSAASPEQTALSTHSNP